MRRKGSQFSLLKGLALKSHDRKSKSIKIPNSKGEQFISKRNKNLSFATPPLKKNVIFSLTSFSGCLGGLMPIHAWLMPQSQRYTRQQTQCCERVMLLVFGNTEKLSSKVKKSLVRVHAWWTPKQKNTNNLTTLKPITVSHTKPGSTKLRVVGHSSSDWPHHESESPCVKFEPVGCQPRDIFQDFLPLAQNGLFEPLAKDSICMLRMAAQIGDLPGSETILVKPMQLYCLTMVHGFL